MQYDDKELFSQIAEGNKAALIKLFKKYTPRLFPFISRVAKSDHITDEIIQETFMRIWFNREKLTEIAEPANWIYRITANVCYRFLEGVITENKPSTTPQEYSNGDKEIFESSRLYNLASDIHYAITNLTHEQKKVYRLSREKGMKIAEIADALSLSPNKVRTLLNSSVEFVQDYLQEKQHSL